MIKTNLFQQTPARSISAQQGKFSVLEYEKDLSVTPQNAMTAYFASQMNVRKRQVIAELKNEGGIIMQAGAMQMMMGKVEAAANVKSAADLMKKFLGSKVTGESAIKPHYTGEGIVVFEPTYKYILLENMADWNGSMVIEDGMFLACDDTVSMKVAMRTNISSAALGNEGLFNTALTGEGTVVLESPVPAEELIMVELYRDTIKIDGSQAIAWTEGLEFTVEKTTKTLVGSAVTGEGLVNVYRGTGKILVAPVASNFGIATPKVTK